MSRIVRVTLVAILALAGLWAGRLALPGITLACTCAAPPIIAGPFDGGEDAVLVGRVGPHIAEGRHAFDVERWFKGAGGATVELQSALVPEGGNSFSFNSCGVELTVGSRLVLAASFDRGWLIPSACSPNADADSAEGRELIAAATRTFGPGVDPRTGGPADEPGGGIDLATIAIGLVLVVILLIAIGIVLAFARRSSSAGTST